VVLILVVECAGPQDRPVPPSQGSLFEGIDLLLLTSLQTQEMGREGYLRELPNVRLPAMEGALPEVVDGLSRVNGRRLGLPVGLSPALIAANQEWLSASGVPLPPLDWTWADYEQAATATVIDRLAELGAMRTEGFEGHPSDNSFFVVRSVQDTPSGMTLYPLPRGPKGRPTPVEALIAAVPIAARHPELAMEFVGLLNAKDEQLRLARAGIRPVTANEVVLSAWRKTVGDRMVGVWDLVVNDLYVDGTLIYPSEVLKSLGPYFRGEAQLDAVIATLRLPASNYER